MPLHTPPTKGFLGLYIVYFFAEPLSSAFCLQHIFTQFNVQAR